MFSSTCRGARRLREKGAHDAQLTLRGELQQLPASLRLRPLPVSARDSWDHLVPGAAVRVSADQHQPVLGQAVEADGPELYHWRWRFEAGTDISGDPLQGWETVCVGLITHVDFYTY